MNLRRTIATRIAILFVFASAATAATLSEGSTRELENSRAGQCDESAPEVQANTVPMMCVKGVWIPTTVGF